MSNEATELSTKPYLIRAIYEWCTDNGYTPYLAVTVDENTQVPMEHVKKGEIVLNISALATSKLQLGNHLVEFQARFGGTARIISVPISNISAIYARENGHGMAFEVSKAAAGQGHDVSPTSADTPAPAFAPVLIAAPQPPATPERPPFTVVGAEAAGDKPDGSPKKKATLTVIK